MTTFDYLKLRILSCFPEAKLLKQGGMPPPRMASLYPTYLCNHRCLGCDYTELNKTNHSLSEAEFRSVTDQLIKIGVRGVEFCGGGEPTLHPSLPQMLDRLAKAGVSVGLLTNGTNLTRDLMEKLLKHGSYCRVSLESASEKIFDVYKRPVTRQAGFKTVEANLRTLVKLRNGQKSKLQVSIKYSIDATNYKDAANAAAFAAGIGADSLQFKLIRNMPSELKNKKILGRLTERIEKLRPEYPGLAIIPGLKKTHLKGRCWLSPLQLTIDPFGDVYICCYYRHRADRHRLGNMLKKPLKDIWYSKDHLKKIRDIKKKDCDRYDCRFHSYNEMMNKLVIDDIGQMDFI